MSTATDSWLTKKRSFVSALEERLKHPRISLWDAMLMIIRYRHGDDAISHIDDEAWEFDRNAISFSLQYGGDGESLRDLFLRAKEEFDESKEILGAALVNGTLKAMDGDGGRITEINWDGSWGWGGPVIGAPGARRRKFETVRIVTAELQALLKTMGAAKLPRSNSFLVEDLALVEEMHKLRLAALEEKPPRILAIPKAAEIVAPRARTNSDKIDATIDRLRKLYSSQHPSRKRNGNSP